MGYDKHYEARSIIEHFMKKDLFGPVHEDEIIEGDRPDQYYAIGILYPQKSSLEEIETITDELEDPTEQYDGNIAMSNSYNPSSMAISTTVREGIAEISAFVETAIYRQIEMDIENNTTEDSEELKRRRRAERWRREPLSFDITLDINKPFDTCKLTEGLELNFYLQKKFKDGSKMITFALVNKNQNNKSSVVNNENSFFQCHLKLSATDKHSPVFIEKKMQVQLNEDEEITKLNMLYSHVRNYAVGHGCAVSWVEAVGCATVIESSFLPEYELLQMKPATNIISNVFQMNFLATKDKQLICGELEKFVDSYEKWIEGQIDLSKNINSRFNAVAHKNMSDCKETLKRIRQSICMLSNNKDEKVFIAFQLANRAMLDQRVQNLKNNGKTIDLSKITWYPFQLAFMLQELPSIINPESEYRNIVDLLWFPTGGGKTEAYLGLSAFTIFLRRLRAVGKGGGVTIMMRYTLRLLTMQQFERAAALICSCERIREKERMDNEEIAIGLWVGGGLTPNSLKEAEENLKKVKQGDDITEGNPCQLLKCPWCGAPIGPDNYKIKDGRMAICCSDNNCNFSKGLPVYLIDEDIYNFKPTLVVSTVDKFARMAWEPKVGAIFGIDSPYNPPELIIQDELHLISGPLGTITGLYEIAIKKFCEKNNIGAKVIASTATIRKAGDQILRLYGEDYRQFPPQGVNMRDSYFAEESTRDHRPSRKYVGIMSSSKSSTTMLVRVYACLLFSTRYLMDLGFDDSIVDSYWTITGYFNSLRELGGANVQVLDDVQDRYEFLYGTKFKEMVPTFTATKRYDWITELTSRKKNSEIAQIIQNELKVKYPSKDAFDFVLASNMLSVGIDIGRLGLMVVTGQPKTNAEYIQASSRVGRENPGLVFVIYNSSHSRDRSHYEQFTTYHSAIYKYVEATSITPFSPRAREKALHAVFISLCRHLIDGIKHNGDAANFDITKDEVSYIMQYLLDYVEKVDKEEHRSTAEDLQDIMYNWDELAEKEDLVYQKSTDATKLPLLKDNWEDRGAYRTLNSMRNVDQQSNIFVEED